METIRFNNVNFRYPLAEKDALKNIDLSVEESEFIVLCGKSGCGKTTFLRHMKKNMMPYGNLEGNILYEGKELSELQDRESASKIGYVQQNPDNQLVTDKVWHELAFGLESLGFDNYTIKRRVAEMASYFDIQEWFRRDVSQLSGGQKQLLNLASIMAMQPKLLVLDEPTSQLDPIAASEFLRTIYKINRDLGTTIILSEHRLEEAFTMADRVVVMDSGKIVACDSPRKIGGFLASNGEFYHENLEFRDDIKNNCHPMFYGLPAVTKIFQSAMLKHDNKNDSGIESPLTIREGRLWIKKAVEESKKKKNFEDGSSSFDGVKLSHEEISKHESEKNRENAIEISNLWFRYDRKSQDIIRNLNINVGKGELFCVLGGNGVGKSTTLKAISNIIKPQRGKIKVFGKQAMLPQNPQALFTEISVEDELMETLHYEEGGDEEKVNKVLEMLEIMEISHLRKSHPYDLSGGEQQRLALGKVLLLDPDVILLDEPTKGLDPFFKISLAKVFKKLTQKGKTLFMVSHDIEFCAEYGDECAMFFDGSIASHGKPKDFFRGNNFYTTVANKIAREYIPSAITWEEVAEWAETLI